MTWPARTIDRVLGVPHYVYRAFDSYGVLLYIGCTLDVGTRMAQHRSGSAWHRYAETIAIAGPWSREDALKREADAINSEASYFNSTPDDMKRTQANRVAATQRLAARGLAKPTLDNSDRYDDVAYADAHDAAYECWDRQREALKLRLKDSGAYPYLTDADRLARYRAAREDAEIARQERAA